MGDINETKDIGNGLISSDSDFEDAVKDAGYELPPPKMIKPTMAVRYSAEDQAQHLKNDVSKTFRKMLTSNHRREYKNDGHTNTIITSPSIVEFEN